MSEHEEPTTQPTDESVQQSVETTEPTVTNETIEETEYEVEEPFTPTSKKANFTQSKPVGKAAEPGKEPKLEDCIALLRETTDVVRQALEHNNTVLERLISKEEAVIKEHSRTKEVIDSSIGNANLRFLLGALARQVQYTEDLHEDAIYREDAHWVQSIEHEGKTLGPGIPVQRLANGKYSHEELMSYVTRKTGTGATVDFPMWHSGLWLRFKSPSIIDLTALNQEIANIKVNIGSETRGLAFSNVSHFVKSQIVDFALQHVVQANINYTTPTDLKDQLDTRDFPALVLGLAATLYPNGYPYGYPCIADPGNCDHITRELVNVKEFLWVDNTSLSKWQRQHMSMRINERSPKTIEDLETYRANHTRGGERLLKIGEFGFILKCPTLYEHEEMGANWLNGIIEMSQGAFNEPPEGRNRSVFIQQLANSTSAREYAHWVKAMVELDDDSPEGYRVLSEDKEFTAQALANIYSGDELIDEFVEGVERYINDSLITLTAIPTFNCPSCNGPIAEEFKERFENLVPVDAMNEFFTLGIRKLSRVM